MTNPTTKYNDIDFEKDIKLCTCGSNISFIYNDKPLNIQTAFHEDYSIPSIIPFDTPFLRNINSSISSRSFIKVKHTHEMFDFYQNLDKFLSSELFKTKLGSLSCVDCIGTTKFIYNPIIKCDSTIKYFLPYNKKRTGYPEDLFSRYDNIGIISLLSSEDDKYFEYTSFNYKLFKNINGIRQEIPFDSFDEFTTYVKHGTNIRFIFKPKLCFRRIMKTTDPDYDYDYDDTMKYFVRLDVYMIEIK